MRLDLVGDELDQVDSTWGRTRNGAKPAPTLGRHLPLRATERSSRKTVSHEEQILFKDKYPSTFSPQMEAIVFIILQIFFATHAVLKIGEYSRIFPSFSWGIFAHVTRLDQSRASENIGWIILNNYSTSARWIYKQ